MCTSRFGRIVLFCLIALGAVAARAADEDPPALRPDDVELLPLTEYRLDHLRAAHAALFEAIGRAQDELEEHDEEAQEHPGGAWGTAERREILARRAAAVLALGRLLRQEGVDPGALRRAAAFPLGPARAARFAHAQVRALPDVPPRPRALLATLTAAVDGAITALARQQGRLLEGAEGQPRLPESVRERVEASFDAQRERIESRFWRVVDYVLDEPAKGRLKARLPVEFQGPDDWLPHALQLPGLTVGQAGRLRALEAALEADAGPEYATAERLERQLRDLGDDAPADERRALEQQLDRVWRRVAALENENAKRVREVLGPKLWASLRGIPPRIEPEQREQGPGEVLLRVAFDPAQVARLAPLVKRYRDVRRRMEQAYEQLEEKLEDFGPDSPQMEGMEMQEAVVTGRLAQAVREIMRDVFLTVMTPAQVVDWVLAPG